MGREEIQNDMDKNSVIKRLGHINKTLLDITNILIGQPAVHNYFRVEQLPMMVTVETAKIEFEMDRKVLRKQLSILENIELEDLRSRRFQRDRNKHFDTVKEYKGREKSA